MKKIVLFMVVALVLFTGCTSEYDSMMNQKPVSYSGGEKNSFGNVDTALEPVESEPETDLYQIGEKGEIGNFAFTINSVSERTTIDDSTTEGKFIVVEIKAENVGKEADAVDDSFFSLIDDQDRQYESFDYYFSENGLEPFAIDGINPGLSKTGHVVFEVPKDASIITLAATDNMFDFGGGDYIFFDLQQTE